MGGARTGLAEGVGQLQGSCETSLHVRLAVGKEEGPRVAGQCRDVLVRVLDFLLAYLMRGGQQVNGGGGEAAGRQGGPQQGPSGPGTPGPRCTGGGRSCMARAACSAHPVGAGGLSIGLRAVTDSVSSLADSVSGRPGGRGGRRRGCCARRGAGVAPISYGNPVLCLPHSPMCISPGCLCFFSPAGEEHSMRW